MDVNLVASTFSNNNNGRCLSEEQNAKLEEQNKRLVPKFKVSQLEKYAQKFWDLFYKRNQTNFFKNRHWTTREFNELLHENQEDASTNEDRYILEVGCGVGNFIYPLWEELNLKSKEQTYIYACDFSPRAINFIKTHPLYDDKHIKAFQCDITTNEVYRHVSAECFNIISMIFVLSTITPEKFSTVIMNLYKVLKSGGMVIFRDYGLYDMSQLRYKCGHKIAENFYMRQDGTRTYYFTDTELSKLFVECNFEIITCSYVHRRTINIKSGIDVPRVFLQAKFRKLPTNTS